MGDGSFEGARELSCKWGLSDPMNEGPIWVCTPEEEFNKDKARGRAWDTDPNEPKTFSGTASKNKVRAIAQMSADKNKAAALRKAKEEKRKAAETAAKNTVSAIARMSADKNKAAALRKPKEEKRKAA